MDASDNKNECPEELQIIGQSCLDSPTKTTGETSAIATSSPSSGSNAGSPTKDSLFEPTIDMMVNDFDDERTLEEEEALAAKQQEDPIKELNDLQKESDMPIEELLKLYNFAPPPTTSTFTYRKRKRRNESKSSLSKKEKNAGKSKSEEPEKTSSKEKETEVEIDAETEKEKEIPGEGFVEPAEPTELEIEDDEVLTTTTNNPGSNDLEENDDDTTNYDEEPSELCKLYTENFDKKDLMQPYEEEDDDLEYVPDTDSKKIMVGGDYQAVIPSELCKYDDALPYENEDKLLWDPSKMDEMLVEDYLNKIQALINASINPQNGNNVLSYYSAPGIQTNLRDDEQALFLLLQCGYNSEEALRRRRINGVSTETPTFSEEECKNFEKGLRMHGKCFYTIQQKVRTRSVGELVQFYYAWKKTERHDLFAKKARFESKKYNGNPCFTDFMDKFLEDQEGGATRDRSTSPNVNSHSLLSADTKRTRLDSTKASKENLLSESDRNQVDSKEVGQDGVENEGEEEI